ncbi:hypothetical protein J6590_052238 [Homalodisca vitripennis]|nr:hypothetical protein J6590_052238 [Homalodisca vitripennis]
MEATCNHSINNEKAFAELKILTVVNLYILEAVSFLDLKSPEAARTGTQIHSYNTRHASSYQLPYLCTCQSVLTATERKPTYAGAKFWNALPEDLKKTNRLQFGQLRKCWLQEHPFYQLDEFYQWTDNA